MSILDNNDVFKHLYNIGAVKFGEFKLKLHETNPDAPLSPIYIDLRLIRSYPDLHRYIAYLFLDALRNVEYDLIADVPTGATTIVAAMSILSEIPMVSPRKDSKSRGSNNVIDGHFEEGQKVVVIDDLITWANSKIETINKLKENGLVVNTVVVLLDRMQGGIQQLSKIGIECISIFNIREMLNFYIKNNLISPSKVSDILQYLLDNTKE